LFSVGRDEASALYADGGVGKANISAADGGRRPDEGTASLVCDHASLLPCGIVPQLGVVMVM